MKKLLTLVAFVCVCFSLSADIRVLSDTRLGEGFYPRFVDSETVVYLAKENADYYDPVDDAALRVDNENLDLNLYRNGEKVVLKPHGDANYIWSSLSPDQTMILFNTKYGTGICDLNGKEIINLGKDFDAPVWFGNNYVVGMDDNHDGYRNTESSIMIASVDGKVVERLTKPEGMGMYPNVDVKSGRVVYNTEDGEIRLLQLNLTEEAIRKDMPRMVQKADGTVLNHLKRQAKRASSTNPADYKIYINPGHGGYGSNDRGMFLYPYFISGALNKNSNLYDLYLEKLAELKAAGNAKADSLANDYARRFTFWESTSNLDKGLRLDTILRDLGFKTKMSRIHNTEDDDRSLSGISAEASNWNADFMLSIHSNAGGPSNYVLQLHSGITPGDPYGLNGYPEKVPEAVCNEARAITTLMGQNQYSNKVSCWSREPMIAGDKTFARTIMGWSNGYGVMRNLKVPGTISEGMMHDYLPETYRLMNIDYKRQESFLFAKTFVEHFCGGQLKDGAIGGKINDDYQEQTFPNYMPRKNTRDVYRPINRGVVELWQNDKLLKTYVTDTLYNGCYFFWNLQPGTYTVKARPEGYYPQEETVEVKKNEISYALFAMSLKRQTPPEVIGYTPKVESLEDSVQVSVQPTISFNWDMDKEATAAALTISPAVEGTVVFDNDNRTLRFVPATRFEPGMEYTITLGTGACHPDPSVVNNLQEPFSFKFRTQNRGSVRVIQTYPAKDEVNVPVNASFVVLFDAKITGSVTKKNVAVIDEAGNELPIDARYTSNAAIAPYGSISFELVSELAPNSQYSLVLKPGIKDVDGVLLNETKIIPFTTGEKSSSTLPLVDDMENTEAFFVGDKDGSVDVKSLTAQRDINKKYAGLSSNKLSYTFAAQNGKAWFNAKNPTLIIANSESRLGMYVLGDYSFNELYARWAVEGDIQYTKICDLDYAGWLFQEADMAALPAGVDYQFMGLQIVCKDGLMSQKGSIYIDNLCADKVTSGSTAVEDVVVEESANGKYIENGYLHILFNGVKYNAEGKVVK